MSTTVAISLSTEQDDLPVALQGILERTSLLQTARRTSTFTRHRIERTRTDLVIRNLEEVGDVAAEVADSEKCLEIDGWYALPSGHPLPITLSLYGKLFESGAPHDLCGPLRLAMSLNDLSRPLWDRAAEAMTTPEELARLGGLYLNDARELFFRTCGLTGFSTCESAVNHAGMYLEYGWPSPVGCSMIYHRSEWDFFRDLERIYLEYQLGIPYHRALAGLDSVTGMEGMKPPLEFYRQFDKPDGKQLIGFLKRMDNKGLTDRLLRHSDTNFYAWFWDHVGTNEDIYCDRLDGGLVLYTFPTSGLWPMYERLYSS